MISRMLGHEYTMAQDWFEAQRGVRPSVSFFSDFGYLFSNQDMPVACIFMYPIIGNRHCIIGWPVGNPQASKEARDEALDALINYCERMASAQGYLYVDTWASHKAVEDRFKKHNYHVGDPVSIHMFKNLGGK